MEWCETAKEKRSYSNGIDPAARPRPNLAPARPRAQLHAPAAQPATRSAGRHAQPRNYTMHNAHPAATRRPCLIMHIIGHRLGNKKGAGLAPSQPDAPIVRTPNKS